MYSKYITPLSSLSHHAHCHLHLIVVASQWHSPCVLHCHRGDGGGRPGSCCRCPCCPPSCCPHPPRGAGWWWWGCRHRRAPHLARPPRHRSRPRHHLVVMPVPLLVIPLVVIDMSPWHWPWMSCHRCHCVDAGRVVGSPSIILLLLLCPSLLLLLPSPSSLLSHCCPPRLPPVVVVHD